MKQKQSMVIFVNYKDNYDKTTTTANNSMGFDLSAIQSCLTLKFPKELLGHLVPRPHLMLRIDLCQTS